VANVARQTSVLLVEDDLIAAMRVGRLLARGGPAATVRTAATLAEAEVAFGEEAYDLVLLDLSLPDAFGVDLIEAVRRLAPDAALVVLTGLHDDKLARAALQHGAQDYLHKDRVTAATLARSLRYALERQRWAVALAEEQRRVRAEQDNFRGALQAALAGVVVVGDDDRVRFANETAADVLGPGRCRVGDTLPIEIPEVGARRRVELSPRTLEVQTARVRWDAKLARLVSLLDVTAQVEAEAMHSRLAEAEQTAAVGNVAAGIAHEINNPAAAVLTNVELADELVRVALRDGEDPAEVRRGLEIAARTLTDARHGMLRISRVTARLRAFSRIDVEDEDTCRLDEVVDAALSQLDHRTRESAQISVDHPAEKETLWVRGGDEPLRRVVIDLVNNAVAAAEAGRRPRVLIKSWSDVDGVHLSVEDDGRGIAPENLPRVFDPFFSTAERPGGGLGLTIARDVVVRFGGRIEARHRTGGGSVLHLTLLPVQRPDVSHVVGTAAEADSPTLLVVDDEDLIRSAYARLLAGTYRVVTAASGDEALAAFERGLDPAVVLCDLVMPGVDGPELLARVRETNPALAERFVFVTGGAFTPRIESFVDTTTHPVLFKPLQRRDLVEAVRAVIAWAQPQRAQAG
jgi:signal transduction histidine kinase